MNAARSTRLTFASGGWVLALAALVTATVIVTQVVPVLRHRGSHALGDGVHPESYGFDLSNLDVPRATLVAAGVPRDGIPALVGPAVMTPDDVVAMRRAERKKYLVPSDLVIGIALGGAARAYPLRIMAWHEVANDVLGGRPIVVTYSPLAGAALAFERDAATTYGVSGLLWQSSLVMYDRGPHPSLWFPLLGRAITGPAVGRGALARVPLSVVRWDEWCAAHPETTVLRPDPALRERYDREPYSTYAASDVLKFPVDPTPPEGGLAAKERVVALTIGGAPLVVPYPLLAARRTLRIPAGAGAVTLEYRDDPPHVAVSSTVGAAETTWVDAYWFAIHATRPGARPITE